MKKVHARSGSVKSSSIVVGEQRDNAKSKGARTALSPGAEDGTGLQGFAPFSAAVLALLCVSCATQVGMETTAFVGGPASALLEEHGDPDILYEEDGINYIAYRVALPANRLDSDADLTNDRCSVIYTVREDTVLASSLVGFMCHEVGRIGRVNNLAGELEGKSVQDVLMIFGSPDFGGLSDGTGTMVYDYGATSESVAGDAGDGAAVVIGMGFGCTLTITIEDGRVTSRETEGGMCWAASI